ncbi:BMA-EPG-8 [Dirofilaria immitis]|nr:BMA-EPG-8 [Dirofilaria immitis]
MLSDTKTQWTMNPVTILPQNYPVKRMSAPNPVKIQIRQVRNMHVQYVAVKSIVYVLLVSIVKKERVKNGLAGEIDKILASDERCCGHQKVLCGPPSSLKILVDAYKDKLQRIIKFNAQWFLKIFPIRRVSRPEPIVDDAEKRCREMIEEACQEEFSSSPNKMLTPIECGTSSEPCYTICGCDTPDRAQYKILKGWLNIGIPTVPVARPVHNMFAAFVYTIQLVNLLTVNFDVCIPEQISFQEFSSCRKWTKGLFDTDIFKLNHAIVVLCLSLGIESKLIEPLNPFGNLLLLRNIVDDSSSVLKPGHHTLTNEVAVVLEEDLRQICWAERERTEEDGWYIVRYRDNYYDETYDVSTSLRPIPSLSDLEEMLRDFSAFTSPSNRMSEHDFQCILGDASRQNSPDNNNSNNDNNDGNDSINNDGNDNSSGDNKNTNNSSTTNDNVNNNDNNNNINNNDDDNNK